MRIRLFSIVYRPTFVDWFERHLLTSMLWRGNADAIRQHDCWWDIYSDEESLPKVEHLAKRAGINVQMHPTHIGVAQLEILKHALVTQVTICQEHDAAMLLCPPDTVFGVDTWKNILSVAETKKDLCVSVPHVRVNAEGWETPVAPLRNCQLVKRAFDNLHVSWAGANGDLPQINTMTSGVLWRSLGRGLYAVSHRIPTVYLARFGRTDRQFFVEGSFGCWDHRWPEKLVEAQRHRLIAASDAAFAVELTPAETNIPPVQDKVADQWDQYWGDMPHQRANRNAVCVFRAEE